MRRSRSFNSGPVAVATTAAVLFAAGRADAVVISNTVATYDSTSNTNTVDGSATGSTGTAAAFAAVVAAAHAVNNGGVVNFEEANYVPAANPAVDTAYAFNYGAGSTRTLGVTTSVVIDPVTNVNPSSGTISAISGSGVLTNQTSGATDITFTFEPGADRVLSDVAFTMLSRTNYPAAGFDFTVTANFLGGGTQVQTANIGNTKGTDDTFFWFQAPPGVSIASIVVDGPVSSTTNAAFDDLAFVTAVPEPASAAAAGIAAVGMLAARCRRRAVR